MSYYDSIALATALALCFHCILGSTVQQGSIKPVRNEITKNNSYCLQRYAIIGGNYDFEQ